MNPMRLSKESWHGRLRVKLSARSSKAGAPERSQLERVVDIVL